MNLRDEQGAEDAAVSAPAAPPPAGPPHKARRPWVPALLAAGVVLGLWGPNLLRPPPPAWTAYISIKGQIRRVKLADHSLLRLNGASAVKVMFEDRLRRAAFDGGEAVFDVAPNARPFLLSVGDRQITTRTAEFNLRRYGRIGAGNTTLTLRRGLVAVGQTSAAGPATALSPGDQLTWIDGQPSAAAQKIDPNIAFAWESHRLVYRQTPLREVVADLNRYVDRPISIGDAQADDLAFTGDLAIDSEDRMLKRIEAVLPIQAQTLSAAIVLRMRGPCPGPTCRTSAKPHATGDMVRSFLHMRRPAAKPVTPAQP